MKRAFILLALTIPLFFSGIAQASDSDKFAVEGSAGAATGSLYGIGTYGGYASLDLGLKLDHVLLYGDATYEGTSTRDGIGLHTLSAGPLVLVPVFHRLRFGGSINASYVWFDRISENATVGQFGFGTYLQAGVDLVRLDSVTLSLDARGGFVIMPTALYPSIHAGISLRF
jgi:hypothetical protein